MSPTVIYETVVRSYGKIGIAEAARLIHRGDCVAVPTETVYGLAGDATNDAAVARIFAAKGRPAFNPLIVHVLDLAAAERLAKFDKTARNLARRFWPGPLTMVLPRSEQCPVAKLATAGLPTIALRVPQHRAIRSLLEATGLPLAAPSANLSGRTSPTRVEHVLSSLNRRLSLIIDDGPTLMGIESTIVGFDAGRINILRPGPITATMVAEVADLNTSCETGRIEAPGQTPNHYAPIKSLRINATDRRQDEWMIGFGACAGDSNLSHRGDLTEAALNLFDLLHIADASDALSIAIAPIPEDGLGSAINDRLRRAATAKPTPEPRRVAC